MSITDELRKWAKALTHWWYDPVKDEYTYTMVTMPPSIDAIKMDSNIIAIADRIDAAVDGMIELPKDADGEPIRVGDKVTCARSVWQVTGLRLTGLAWGVCCTIFNDHGGSGTNVYPPCDLRHYHAPTVEDVLTEFGIDWEHESDCEDRAALLKEYASKLRLAEGED